MNKRPKAYLGDSVYVTLGGWSGEVVLTTENGLPIPPSNTIVLDIEMLQQLPDVVADLQRQAATAEDGSGG